MPDPLHKSKRIYAIAAILSPYIVRFIVAKTGVNLPEEIMLALNSTITEAISLGIASVLIAWSKATEKVKDCLEKELT